MKTIEAYELTNGTILKNKEEAIKSQKKIDFEKAIKKWANELAVYDNEASIVANSIIEDFDYLKKIFDAR